MDSDAKVYKLIGAVLVRQDLAEARVNVDKRLEYINAEMYDIFLLSILNQISMALQIRLFSWNYSGKKKNNFL